jgi:hypothetical protein
MLTSSGAMLRVLPTICCCRPIAVNPASRKSEPCAMFTVRIRPKMSVKPEATTNSRPANVMPSSSVTANLPGSLTAGSAGVPSARTSTQSNASRSNPYTTSAGSRRTRSRETDGTGGALHLLLPPEIGVAGRETSHRLVMRVTR